MGNDARNFWPHLVDYPGNARARKNLSRIPRVVFPFFNSEIPMMKRARAQQRQRLRLLLRWRCGKAFMQGVAVASPIEDLSTAAAAEEKTASKGERREYKVKNRWAARMGEGE